MDRLNPARFGTLPLEGITVVDLTQVVAGPFASMTLGDMGAEVIKIEAIGRGDRSREIEPSPEYFDTVNRNKRSVELDLKDSDGQEIARSLVASADVFVESTKPGRIDDFGLDYDTVVEDNPEVVYCSISGFGSDSPYRDVPAWDMLIQGMSGIMSMTGEPDGPPLWSGLMSGDLCAAMYAVQSILAALFAREQGRIEGEYIEVPMLDAAISWLACRAGYTFGTGEPFPRLGTHHPSIAPFGVYECSDGPIVVAAGTQSLWRDLCGATDRSELVEDPRFETLADRVDNQAELRAELGSVLAERPVEEWVPRLQEAGVPAGPIHDTETVWDDEHVRHRNLHRVMEHESREDADVIDHPVRFRNLDTDLGRPPEELGESTEAILERLGFDASEIERLRDDDVVG